MAARAKAVTSETRSLPELDDFAEQIGQFIEYWGFKRVHGRLWTHLMMSEEPLDASQLIRRLRVSKALVSMSLSDLLEHEVVEEAGKSARGTQLYRARQDVLDVILNVLRGRERRMLARIWASYTLLKSLPAEEFRAHGIDREQVKLVGGLIEGATKALESFLTGFRFDLSVVQTFRWLRSTRPR